MSIAMIEGASLIKRAWNWLETSLSHDMNNFEAGLKYIYADIRALFDTDWNHGAYIGKVETERTRREREIEGNYDKGRKDADKWRRDMRKAAEDEHRQQMARIGRESAARSAAIREEHEQTAAAIAEQIAQAQAEWAAARAEAAAKLAAGGDPETPGADDFLNRVRALMGQLDGLIDGIDAASQRQDVRGTFNAAAIQGLQGSLSAQERTAKATEKTAREAGRTRTILENYGGSAFA